MRVTMQCFPGVLGVGEICHAVRIRYLAKSRKAPRPCLSMGTLGRVEGGCGKPDDEDMETRWTRFPLSAAGAH